MTREEFNNLDILEQVEYINNELINSSLNKIAQSMGMSESTIRDRFKNKGYKRQGKKYTKVNKSIPTEEEPENKPIKKLSNTPKKTTNTNTQEDKIKALEGQIKSLENEIKNIYKLLNSKVCTEVNKGIHKDIIHKDIEGLRGTETTRRTYLIYNDIDKRLQEHIQANKQYKIQDIINSILVEYLNKL